MSARNLSGFEVMVVSELNTYAVTNANKLVFVESAVSQLNNMFSN
jgi:ribosomal protein L4